MSVPNPAEVVVVGSVNADTTLRVSRLPRVGETLMGREVFTSLGGKGANQAVSCARQDVRVALVGRLGDDAAGAQLRATLDAERLDLSSLRRAAPGVPSGQALITVDDTGENTIVVISGANTTVSPTDVDAALPLISSARVVLVQLELPVSAVTRALQLGRSVGAITILNPAPAVGSATDLADLLSLADVVVPNETEAARLVAADDPRQGTPRSWAEQLHQQCGATVIVTVGADGAIIAGPEGSWSVPSPQVAAVDATAAGDAFCGVLAASLARGVDLKVSVRRAAAGGAHAATVAGALASLPTAAQVEALLVGPDDDSPS